MAGTAIVRRPTEDRALGLAEAKPRTLPPAERLADLLIVARVTGDRYGARIFDCMLDRAMGAAQ